MIIDLTKKRDQRTQGVLFTDIFSIAKIRVIGRKLPIMNIRPNIPRP